MKFISVEDAKKNLEKILSEVEKGEKVILKSDGKEYIIYPKKRRKLGIFKNKIKISPDIKEPIPETLTKRFYD